MQNPFNFFKKSFNSKYSLFKSVDRQTSNLNVTPTTGLTLNEISLYLNKGISKRGEKVGQTQFQLFKGDKEIFQHEILNLLDRPNKRQTGKQFWKLASIYKDATGFVVIRKKSNNAVFTENAKVTELEILNSAFVTINYTKDKTAIESFTYVHPNAGQVDTILYEECIYWYTPDPKNDLVGLSIIQAGILATTTEIELSKQYNQVVRNGGSVDAVLSFKDAPTKEQLEEIKMDYRNLLEENKTSNMPIILGGEAEYTKVGLNPRELQFLEVKNALIEDLVVITGVPKAILGLTSGETFANADIAHRIFLRETIKPLVEDLVNVLDWRLVPDDLELRFVDPTPEDVEEKIKIIDIGNRARILTNNEMREMLGFDAIKGGDEIKQDPQIPQEKQGIFVHPLRNKDFRHNYHKQFLTKRATGSRRLKGELVSYFKDQKKRIIDRLTAQKSVHKKELLNDLFNENLEVTLMMPLLNTIKEIAIAQGQETFDLFNNGFTYNYSTALDSAITRRFDFFTSEINATTGRELEKAITDWNNNNETTNDLVKRINDIYADLETPKSWRAETIANTETSTVMNLAKGDAYKQIGISTKIWVWSAGIKGGVRDDHLSIDGEEVPFNQAFSNGMMHPHDPSADAGEVVGCECTW